MSTKTPIPAAITNEVQRKKYLDKIKSLEVALNRLNILENPLEIRDICHSIIDIKKFLEKKSTSG